MTSISIVYCLRISRNMMFLKIKKGIFVQFFSAVTANLMAVTEGMALCWTAPMIPYFLSSNTHIKMTQNQAEWMETWFVLGGIAGLPFTMLLVHKIGPKKSLLLATFVMVLCWITIGLTYSLICIYVARGILGLGLNIAYIAAPMYVGEIAETSIRGFLCSNVFVMQLLGMILMYSIGPFAKFYVTSLIAAILLIIELSIFSFMPETPYFLVSLNQYDKAKESLQIFRANDDVEEELKEIIATIEANKQEKAYFKDIFFVKNYRKAIIIMFILNMAEPFSSFEVIMMNFHEILSNSDSIYMEPSYAAIIFSTINLVAVIVASLLMDRFGRKKLLTISTFFSGMCILLLAIYYNLKYIDYDVKSISWVPLACVFIFAGVFKIGMGIVPIVLTAEIFANKIKAIGMTIADGFYMGGILLALQVYFTIRDYFGMHVAFYLFSSCSFLTCLLVRLYIPETKGKSLDEIQHILKGEHITPRSKLSM